MSAEEPFTERSLKIIFKNLLFYQKILLVEVVLILGDYRISSIGLEKVISIPKTKGKFDDDGNYTVKFSHSGSRLDLPNLRTKQSDLMKQLVKSEYQKQE